MPTTRGPGQPGKHETNRDSVLELLDQFPSPISPSSPVTPAVGSVSLVSSPPPSTSNTPTMSMTFGSPKSDTFSEFNTRQRCSEVSLFSPLFQTRETLQEQGSRFSHDTHEPVQLVVPGGIASHHRTLARSSSNFSASSLGGASDMRPRSHWTAEEEALVDEYRCRGIQESNSDISRATRDSSIIFYNPFTTDSEDDEDEEDLPIEVLRKRLKLVSTLLPQSLDTTSVVLDPTMTPRARATSTEDPGLLGIGCGSSDCSHSAFMPSHPDVDGDHQSSLHPPPALSTKSPIVSRSLLGEYSPPVERSSLAKAHHEEPFLERGTEAPFQEYLPVNFELALGGISRYPAFPNSSHPESRFILSSRTVVANQPSTIPLAQSSPNIPASFTCNVLPSRPDNPTDHSEKRGSSEPTLMGDSKRSRNNPNVEDPSGVKGRGFPKSNTLPCLPAAFGIHEADANEVQTIASNHGGLEIMRRVVGASNWRPPTCWEMPGWEPAIELIGERDDQGHIVTVSPPPHTYGPASSSSEPFLAFASSSRATFIHASTSPSLPSSSISAPNMSPEMQVMGRSTRSSPLAFTRGVAQLRGRRTSRPNKFLEAVYSRD